MKLTKLTPIKAPPPKLLQGPPGKDGKQGPKGDPGESGVVVREAVLPAQLLNDLGEIPKILGHLTKVDAKIQELEKRPGQQFIGGVGGSGGVSQVVRYVQQSTTPVYYTDDELISGINIIGVTLATPSEVYLPRSLSVEKIVTVKDETGAGLVTIRSY